MSALRQVVDRDGARKADLAAIHIAKATLQLDDEAYRDLLSTVCAGVRSAGSLDFAGRKRFLAHLQACMKARCLTGRAGPARAPREAVRAPLKPAQKKMWSLWMQLADAHLIEGRSMASLVAFAHRQTGVDRLEWLNSKQEELVIESLKKWLDSRRGGAA